MTAALLCVLAAMSALPQLRPLGPLPASLTIVLMIWLGARYSGASFNPIRNLAPAAFARDWAFQAQYLAAPMLAALGMGALAAVLDQRRTDVDAGRESSRPAPAGQ
jgi:glycerol uptake facilitator-like aquaporin